MPGSPGYGTGPDVRARARRGAPGSTSAKVKVNRKTGRVTQPKYRRPRRDSASDSLLAYVEGYEQNRNRTLTNPSGGSQSEAQATARRFQQMGLGTGGGNWLTDLLGNAGADIADIVTGTPSAVMLAGKTTAYPFLKLTGQEGAQDVEEDIGTAYRSMAENYKYKYGPFFEGNLKEGAKRTLFENPIDTLLDASFVYSGAGAATRLGAVGLGKLAPTTRLGQAAARTGSKAYGPGTARARPPGVLRRPINREGGGAFATAEHLLGTANPRPYSANPITRSVQRFVDRRLQARRDRSAELAGQNRADLTRGQRRRVSRHEARFDMAERRQARDQRLAADMQWRTEVERESRPLQAAMAALDKEGRSGAVRGVGGATRRWTREQADVAIELHATDQLRVPGKTARQAADDVAGYWERNQSRNKAAGERVENAAENPAIVRSLPDELLDINNPSVARAVQEYKALANQATERRIALYEATKGRAGISRVTATERAMRPARMVNEGIVFDKETGTWTSPRNPYSDVGTRGVYLPHEAVDARGGTVASGKPGGQMGRRQLDKIYQDTGRLFSGGNIRMDRGLPSRSLQRAAMDETHSIMTRDFYESIAYRKGDKILKNDKAALAFIAQPNDVVLISTKSLEKAARTLDELPDGVMPDGPFDNVQMFEGQAGVERLRALGNRPGKGYIAVPASAVKGIREGWETMGGQKMKWFDTPQSLWKRGILALAPRWYFNSLVGNTLMYGMATGGDLRSVARVMRNPELNYAIPGRIRGATNVQEFKTTELAARNKLSEGFRKVTDPLIGFQSGFDALFRKALYVRRVSQGLRAEGVKTRGMTPEQFAEAVRTAPKHIVNQAMREVELFLGDYIRLSPAERMTLRRVFPFYSWMRVIGRFMLEVPIRHPKRAAISAMLANAAADAINPEDVTQPILANRGRLKGTIPGWVPLVGGQTVAMRTAAPNPGFTHVDLASSLLDQDWQGAAQSIASNTSPIALQQLLRIYSGKGPFGAPVSYPAGEGGTYSEYGKPTKRDSGITGLPSYFEPSFPITEALLQTIPVAPQIARGLASRGREPYDTATTPELISNLISGGGFPEQLFRPERDRAMEPFSAAGPFLSWAGIPIQRYDKKAERDAYRKLIADAKSGKRQTKRRIKRSQAASR